ncbi:FAD-dependent oxidoreductase [Embleya sp. NBC_00896]|uniref:FAD-dependent oxidoreductase n=1 Tax=Embleya sp. NBC_00896 TaxID=2975961 RepID=UPI00386DCCD6|nr:FAD-dependent monooxygenase [Embleya sp. NBC_00896]
MRILVIGAGIGGLAAAHALRTDGHDVTVFERAPALRTSGSALTLWSNGTGVLADLGISTEGLGAPIDMLEQRDANGRALMRIDVSLAATRYGHPHIAMPRRNLIRRLADALPDGTIVFDKTCSEVSQNAHATSSTHGHGHDAHSAHSAHSAQVTFTDGTTAHGDLVIGADGARSVVRRHVWTTDPTTPTGWATWQGLSRFDVDTDLGRDLDVVSSRRGLMIVGPEGMCGLLPAGDGLLQWWFDVRRTPDEPMPTEPIAALRARFGHWAAPVPEVLAAVTDADVEFFTHYRHKVPRTWSRGSVTLLGDAAHTMPPTVAQGGNQALEDAWTLARALRRTPGIPEALTDYESSRTQRASLTARRAGSETTNKYLPTLSRLTPDALVSRYHTRWLRLISTYLSDRPAHRAPVRA